MVSTACTGKHLRGDQIWSDDIVYEWGRLLAKLHQANRNIEPSKIQDRPNWLSLISNLSAASDCYGLIHGDVHPGNFLVEENVFKVIDFDYCYFGWFGLDLACPLLIALTKLLICKSDIDFWKFRDQLIAGYSSVTALNPAIFKMLPVCMRYRRLLDYLHTVKVIGFIEPKNFDDKLPPDQEFLRWCRNNFRENSDSMMEFLVQDKNWDVGLVPNGLK